jgi:hypothetical protein
MGQGREGQVAPETPSDVRAILTLIGYTGPVAYSCHEVSLALARSGHFPGARVARGFARNVMGQHSWLTTDDPYNPLSPIIDFTLWSYDPHVKGIWVGTGEDGVHIPHGAGHFMRAGMPYNHGEKVIRLVVNRPLSEDARDFLAMLGPLDYRGWAEVAHLPVEGWPAGEIFAAMDDTPGLGILVPIDVMAMTTGRNVNGLYA